MPYHDLRDYLQRLERDGKLHHISSEVEKEWEIAAICRRVFQRIPPSRRPALMFDHVRGHAVPVVAGILGASPEVYATALETTVAGIAEKWVAAQTHPIPPIVRSGGPCKENILTGSRVDIGFLPVPTWTVEHDPGPFFTSPFVVTKDPDTGIRNVGTYRMQVKGPTRTGFGGFHIDGVQHIAMQIRRYRELGRKMPVAVVVGADPTVGLVSVTRVPYEADELAVAGGLRGEPLEVVPCETVDLEVPATAEIVLEGEVDPSHLEEEGPFGEYPGYMGASGQNVVFEIKAVTHRHQPIYQAFVSQMPPSESSCIRGVGRELALFQHLRHSMGLPVTAVHYLESGGSTAYLVVAIKKDHETQPREVMWAAWSANPDLAKWTVIVDDDIDVRSSFAVEWALSFRVLPHLDIYVESPTLAVNLDPSQARTDIHQNDRSRLIGSKVGIDATRKHPYPPVALPPGSHLEEVDRRWSAYGLPPVT